jgi:hypothetical protein
MAARTQRFPRVAILVDAENHADLHISSLMQRLERFDIVERHAYADWRDWRLDRLAEQLEDADFEMHHTWSGHCPGVHKDRADDHIARAISRVLSKRSEIEAIVIISGDKFFAQVAKKFKQQGKQVIVAADPLRVSNTLCSVADEYLPVGKLARWIRWLDRLEQVSRYLTFRFAVQRLGIEPACLAKLIRRGEVIQKEIERPQRGIRREIWLNRQSPVVQAVLNATL